MYVPNADQAVISERKLREYLLNPNHADGESKARFLAEAGYTRANAKALERDLRVQHLTQEAEPGRPSPYGRKYEVSTQLTGPNGVSLRLRSIWIVRFGRACPELVTLIPEKRV